MMLLQRWCSFPFYTEYQELVRSAGLAADTTPVRIEKLSQIQTNSCQESNGYLEGPAFFGKIAAMLKTTARLGHGVLPALFFRIG